MNISKNIIRKIATLTILFLIGMFFVFPPEKPLEHTHDRVKEWSHTVDHNDTRKDIDENDEKILDEYINEIDLMWSPEEHSSAWSEAEMELRLGKICEFYSDLCEKIIRDHWYSLTERYIYTVLVVYAVRTIDQQRILGTPNTLRNTITSIKLYESKQWRRWSAWTTHVRMNTQKIEDYAEFWEVFIHEVGGHILDLGVITDSFSDTLHPRFTEFGEEKFGLNDRSLRFYEISWINENTRRPDASFKDFISWYALKDTFEELAEFSNAWINHHDLLLEVAKTNPKIQEKVDLFQELFWNWHFNDDKETLPFFNPNERVFDSTKSRKNVK